LINVTYPSKVVALLYHSEPSYGPHQRHVNRGIIVKQTRVLSAH